MGLFDRLVQAVVNFKKKQVNILIVGLNNSGKSTIVDQFKPSDERLLDVVPTVGFNVDKFQYKNIGFTAYDMSGNDRYRYLWEHQYRNSHGIIFVIDSNDRLRLVVVKEELDMLLEHPDIAGRRIPILFLANKMDLPDSLTTVKLASALGLENIKNKPWHIQATNALTMEGLQAAIDWFTYKISEYYSQKVKSDEAHANSFAQ